MTTSSRRAAYTTSPHKVPSTLLRRCNPEDKGALQTSFSNAEVYRQAAISYLKKEKLLLEQTVAADYNLASWGYYQADRNGAIRMATQMLRNIFNVTAQEIDHYGDEEENLKNKED